MDDERLDEVQRERDLYRKLLDLGHQTEIEPFLEEALALIVEVTGAQRGYLEILDDRGPGFVKPLGCGSSATGRCPRRIATKRLGTARVSKRTRAARVGKRPSCTRHLCRRPGDRRGPACSLARLGAAP